MANINALIAAGPHTRGFDVQGALGGVEALKFAKTRNALADIGLQEAPKIAARNQTKFEQGQEDRVKAEIQELSATFVRMYEQEGGKQASLEWLQGIQSSDPRVIKIRDDVVRALQSPDPNDDVMYLAQAKALMGAQEQGETFRAATPEELAALGPNVVGAQISSSGKLVNVQQRQDSSSDTQKPPIKLTQINPETNQTEEYLADAITGAEIPNTRRVTKTAPAPSATEIKAEETKTAKQAAERSLITKMEIFGEIMGNERFSHVVGPRDAGFTSKAIGSFLNTEDSQLFRRLEQMSGKEVLQLGGEVLKGSQTEGEWERVALAIPQPKDHEQVWAQWYNDAIRTITSGAPHLKEQLEPLRREIGKKYLGMRFFDETGNEL